MVLAADPTQRRACQLVRAVPGIGRRELEGSHRPHSRETSEGVGGLLDRRCDRRRLRDVQGVASLDVHDPGARTRRHRALGRRWDHVVFGRHDVGARLRLPRRLAHGAAERVHAPRNL